MVTVTESASRVVPSWNATAPPTTATAAAGSITISADLTGQNANIAEDKLEALGLTNVTLSSANPKYTMVLLPEKWTVVSIEPAPGTTVSAADPVVVKSN